MAKQPAGATAAGTGGLPEGSGVSSKKTRKRNRYDRMEWAGAFGDIGTLIPFVVAYITLFGIDPLGLLLAFGASKIFMGLFYRTPVPVQPMKAIGGAAIAQPANFNPNMIWGAGLFTGVFWLVMAATGAVNLIARITTKPIVRGIMLGLGMSFILQGARMMAGDEGVVSIFGETGTVAVLGGWLGPAVAVAAVALTLLLLGNRRLPAMFVLLALGSVVGVVNAQSNPELSGQLSQITLHFRLPEFALGSFGIRDLLEGTAFLALAQVPLTLGNAIIAVTAEHNTIFPKAPVTEKKITITQGFMNLLAPLVGGVPMCHGAGGLAGHVRFGARTGGALVILGSILVLLALFLSESVATLFRIFPLEILGVILLFAGVELASAIRDIGRERRDVYVMLFTAGLAMWHMGWAFLAGLALYYAIRWRAVRL